MKNFKEYNTIIMETRRKRTPEKSIKIVDYILKRKKFGDDSEIDIPHQGNYYHDQSPFFSTDAHKFKYHGIMKLHVNSLHYNQSIITKRGLYRYLKNSLDINEPIDVVNHKNLNNVINGHHRVFVHKLLKRKTIKANYWTTTKEFISEEWKEVQIGLEHRANIGEHHVSIFFHNHGNNEYGVHFSVVPHEGLKGYFSRTPQESTAILHHVRNKIHEFIETHKPNKVSFQPNSLVKQDVYHEFAKSLARKYGGKAEQHEKTKISRVNFFDKGTE